MFRNHWSLEFTSLFPERNLLLCGSCIAGQGGHDCKPGLRDELWVLQNLVPIVVLHIPAQSFKGYQAVVQTANLIPPLAFRRRLPAVY
jgi:hypothetical protein